jgi:hypothetical protein
MKRSCGLAAILEAAGVVGLALFVWQLAAPACAKEPPDVKFSKRCLMVSPNEGCAIADVNKDGKPDIIAGTHWFSNPDWTPRPIRDIPQTMTEFYANNGDHAVDVDGDGWVDVISGGWMEAELNWFKNPGKRGLAYGWKWEPRLLKKARVHTEAYELRDLDGDGVPEIVVDTWDKDAPLVVWKFTKTADGKPDLERIVIGDKGCGHGYAFGDVNGDGREDILCEIGWYERPEKDIFKQPWKLHPETALPHPSCPFLAVDVNGDGRTDLVWGKAHDYGLFWWEQGEPKPDGTTTWKEHLIDKSWSQVHCMVAADIDGDGKNEIITGKRMRGHGDGDPGSHDPEVMYYYKWDAEAKKFDRHNITEPGSGAGTGMQIRVADLNGDGRPDIVVSGKTGTWLLINEGLEK